MLQNRKRNEVEQEITLSFLQKFQLTEEETNALKSTEINTQFFKSLQRVHQIHDDCKILLRTQHQRAGYETCIRTLTSNLSFLILLDWTLWIS
jgi:hypothetical protein